jgi:hypothetical protein
MRIRRGRSALLAIAASSAAAAGFGAPGGADAAGADARLALGDQAAIARLVGTCTRRQARSRRGCPAQRRPSGSELGEPLRLGGAGLLRIRLPTSARRVTLNIGELGDDYGRMVAVRARPAAAGRRRWRAALPERFPPRTNRIVIIATTRTGTERTYHAAAKAAGQ